MPVRRWTELKLRPYELMRRLLPVRPRLMWRDVSAMCLLKLIDGS